MKLPKHINLTITHNDHNSVYRTVGEYATELDWVSEEEKQKAIASNEIWEIQWYPNTPIGFFRVAASNLDVLLDYVNSQEWK